MIAGAPAQALARGRHPVGRPARLAAAALHRPLRAARGAAAHAREGLVDELLEAVELEPDELVGLAELGVDLYILSYRRNGECRRLGLLDEPLHNAHCASGDFGEYAAEIEQAVAFIRAQGRYRALLGYAFSMGGTVLCDFLLARGDGDFDGFVFNSPMLSFGWKADELNGLQGVIIGNVPRLLTRVGFWSNDKAVVPERAVLPRVADAVNMLLRFMSMAISWGWSEDHDDDLGRGLRGPHGGLLGRLLPLRGTPGGVEALPRCPREGRLVPFVGQPSVRTQGGPAPLV